MLHDRKVYYVLAIAIILTVLGIIGVAKDLQPIDMYAIFLCIGTLTLLFLCLLSIIYYAIDRLVEIPVQKNPLVAI